MNFFVQQTITIHTLRIEGITNSSVCQIGSAGIIKPLSNLFNTGCFTEAAPPAGEQLAVEQQPAEPTQPVPPLVPLVVPGR